MFKNRFIYIWLILVLAFGAWVAIGRIKNSDFDIGGIYKITQNTPQNNTQNSNNLPDINTITPPKVEIPATFYLVVPFTSQAPYANWDELHNEACEEASIIMLRYYIENIKKTGTNAQKRIDKAEAEKAIQDLVAWQMKNWGGHRDLTIAKTADMVKLYWGYKQVYVKEATIDSIKKEIASGNPVIVPFAGRMLGNPNFRRPGPLYHMLVVKGYNQKEFITNDPGTRKGEDYRYSQDVIMNALHDWGGTEPNGPKVMIVIKN